MATFELSENADSITGTANDDLIRGGANTLQTADTVNGNGGLDRLVAGVVQNGVQAPTITDVETLFLDTGGLPFDISNVSGAERIFADVASITLRSIETADLSTRFGAFGVMSGTVKLQFADGALEADDDVLLLQANDSNVTFTSNSFFDSTNDGEMNQTADRLRVENINLVLGGAENQVDISDFTALQSLHLFGPASSKIFIDAPTLQRVDARNTTGGVEITNDSAGNQTFVGGSGNDDFKTGSGNDVLRGMDGDDVLTAGGGDNLVYAGDGNDQVTSEQGSDRINAGAGDDFVSSGSGDDVLIGGAGNDELVAGDGADFIYGNAGNDDIRGQGGADTIYDNIGDDVVRAGGDNDTIVAGAGTDEFWGGGGVDTFRFSGGFGEDTVKDFTLTSSTSTNDIVEFTANGTQHTLQSQNDFETFEMNNPDRVSVDSNRDIVTIEADTGTIILEVSDADFLVA